MASMVVSVGGYWHATVFNPGGTYDLGVMVPTCWEAKLKVRELYGKCQRIDRKSGEWTILRYNGFSVHLDYCELDSESTGVAMWRD